MKRPGLIRRYVYRLQGRKPIPLSMILGVSGDMNCQPYFRDAWLDAVGRDIIAGMAIDG